MKQIEVVTLIQPWASLVGIKKIETRSWNTHYRGELYIHAGMTVDREACTQFADELISLGYQSPADLPKGVILSKCILGDCCKIRHSFGLSPVLLVPNREDIWDGPVKELLISKTEQRYGNYADGRYGWVLRDIERLKNPLPAKGQLSIWKCNVPEGWPEQAGSL